MGVAHVGLVHRDPCECTVKGFRAVSFIERNVSKRRHLQGVRHRETDWLFVVRLVDYRVRLKEFLVVWLVKSFELCR